MKVINGVSVNHVFPLRALAWCNLLAFRLLPFTPAPAPGPLSSMVLHVQLDLVFL